MYTWIVAVLVVVLDRITKMLVVNNMSLGQSIPIIDGFFHLTFIRNPGAAFGLFAGRTAFFIGITVVVLLAILYFQRYIPGEQKAARFCIGLILGGAFGNFIDRLYWGTVVDFLDFRIWVYIFNVADSALVVGSLLFALLLFFNKAGLDKEPVVDRIPPRY